ncbi:hypothetical protein LPJ71_011413 [Coemansia sp. S17]|nr:hypothetical protein LPJ71_011413 [Coemansia sp. S17]
MTSIEDYNKIVNLRVASVEARERDLDALKEAVKTREMAVETREMAVESAIVGVKKHEKVVYHVMTCLGECEETAERTFDRIVPTLPAIDQSSKYATINYTTDIPDIVQGSEVSPNKPEEILGSRDTSAPIEYMTKRSKQAHQVRARLEMALEAL